MTSRFVFCRVRQADAGTRSTHAGQDLPQCWLIAERPARATEPTRYWLCALLENTKKTKLIQACKQRWRVEHDYRELKTGLDHYQGPQMGRLAPPRHPGRRRLRVPHLAPAPPKSTSAGLTLYDALRFIQTYLARIIGTCPTCDTKFPNHYPRDD